MQIMKKKTVIVIGVFAVLMGFVVYRFTDKNVNIYTQVYQTVSSKDSFELKTDENIIFNDGVTKKYKYKSNLKVDNKNNAYETSIIETNYTKEKNQIYYDLNKNFLYKKANNFVEEDAVHLNNINKYISTNLIKKVFNSTDCVQKKTAKGYEVTSTISNPNNVITKMNITNDNLFSIYGYVDKAKCPIKLTINDNYEIESIEINLSNYVQSAVSNYEGIPATNVKVKSDSLNYSINYKVKTINIPKQ